MPGYTLVWVAVGGASGAMLRYGLQNLVEQLPSSSPAYGTLFVNVLGGSLMGLLMAWLLRDPEQASWVRSLLMTGFLGSLTTFSTFSKDTVLLLSEGRVIEAAAYVAASVMLSVGACAAGFWLLRA